MHHTADNYLGRRAMELGDQRSLSLSPSLAVSKPVSKVEQTIKEKKEEREEEKPNINGNYHQKTFLDDVSEGKDYHDIFESKLSSKGSKEVDSSDEKLSDTAIISPTRPTRRNSLYASSTTTPIPLSPATSFFLRKSDSAEEAEVFEDYIEGDTDQETLTTPLKSIIGQETTIIVTSPLGVNSETNTKAIVAANSTLTTSTPISMTSQEKNHRKELRKLRKGHASTKKLVRALINVLTPPPRSQAVSAMLSQVHDDTNGSDTDGGVNEKTENHNSIKKLTSIRDLFADTVFDRESELESDHEDEDREDWNEALESIVEPGGDNKRNTSINLNLNDTISSDDDQEDDDDDEIDDETLYEKIDQLASTNISVKELLRGILANQDFPATPNQRIENSGMLVTPLGSSPHSSHLLASSSTQTPPPVPPPPTSISSALNRNSMTGSDGPDEFNTSAVSFEDGPPGPPREFFPSELLTNKNIPPGMFSVIVEMVSQSIAKRDMIHQDITRECLVKLQQKLDHEYRQKLISVQNENFQAQQDHLEVQQKFSQQFQEFQKEKKQLIETTQQLKEENDKLYDKGKNDREIANIALKASQQQTQSFAEALHHAQNELRLARLSGLDVSYDPNQGLSLGDIKRLNFVDDDFYDHDENVSAALAAATATTSTSEAAGFDGLSHNDGFQRVKKPRGYKDFAQTDSTSGHAIKSNTPGRSGAFSQTKYAQRTEKVIPSLNQFDYLHNNGGRGEGQEWSTQPDSHFDRVLNHQFRQEERSLDEFFDLRTSKFKEEEMKVDLAHESKMNKIRKRDVSVHGSKDGGTVIGSYHRENLVTNKNDDKAFYDEEWGGYKLHTPLKGNKKQGMMQGAISKIKETSIKHFAKKVMKDISPFEFFMFVIVPLTFTCFCLLVLITATTHSRQVFLH